MAGYNDVLQCDVVVAGAGYAGLAAALEASRAGANVIVMGRRNPFSCSSSLGGGGFAMADTPLQRKQGISDSAEMLASDILCANGESISSDVVAAAAQEAFHLYDWLTAIGARFRNKLSTSQGHTVHRIHHDTTLSGANMLRLLLNAVKDAGADVKLGTEAQHIMVNNNNVVQGIKAIYKGNELEVRAKRGTILAAGGFSMNKIMMKEFLPDLIDIPCQSGAGSTGNGIRMGREVGAQLLNMDAAMVNGVGSEKGGRRISGLAAILGKGAPKSSKIIT